MLNMFTIVNDQIIREKLSIKLLNYIYIFVKGNFLSQCIDIVGTLILIAVLNAGSNLHSKVLICWKKSLFSRAHMEGRSEC